MTDSFYQQTDDIYHANPHCRGPWHPDFQHGGPPSALIARLIEQAAGDMQVARINLDLLKPVPLGAFDIQLSETTGGKRRRVVQAEMICRDSQNCVVRANALLLRRQSVATDPLPAHDPPAPLPPAQCEDFEFDFFGHAHGYDKAMQLKRDPHIQGPGRARIWMSPRMALVNAEPASALQRILLAVDSGSGVSMALDPLQYSFINADLNVSIRRYARGSWIGLDSRSHFQDCGIGLAETLIWDEYGVIGHATQNLILERLG